MKSLFNAAYLAIFIHFLRRTAEKILPGKPVLYFLALRPLVKAHPIGGYLLVVNAAWRPVPPDGCNSIMSSRHWETVIMSKERLMDYASTWHIRDAIPLHQATSLAQDTTTSFRAALDTKCHHMKPRDVHSAITELKRELRRSSR